MRNTIAILLTALFLVGCASTSTTKTAIKSNTDLLRPASAVVATDKDECASSTTTPGWLPRIFGFGSTVTSTVKCS